MSVDGYRESGRVLSEGDMFIIAHDVAILIFPCCSAPGTVSESALLCRAQLESESPGVSFLLPVDMASSSDASPMASSDAAPHHAPYSTAEQRSMWGYHL